MADKTDTLKKLNKAVNRRAILVHRVSMTTTVIAHLAFTWSTVVLLGGYVTSLEKKDFWCLTVLSLAEATRIFDDTVLNERLGQSVFSFMSTSTQTAVDIANDRLYRIKIRERSPCSTITDYLFHSKLAAVLLTGILMTPVVAAIFSILLLMDISSFLFVALPAWRIVQRDYGFFVGDSDKATLAPALDIFYSLVLLQGGLSFFLFIIRLTQTKLMDRFYALCEFPDGWGHYAFAQYFEYTMAKSKQDLASVEEASLFCHACELLGSESDNNFVTAVSVLGTLAKQGTKISQVFPILVSREKVLKLMWVLRSDPLSPLKQRLELRGHAARVIASFATDISLAHFPGAARCISTLLEATLEGGNNELIVQGLDILDKLTSDHDNCREICRTPGLLPKIMVPICSPDLTQDTDTRIARSPVIIGTFSVLFGLITLAPGKTGRRLRREISCNEQAVTNLEKIIVDQGNKYGDKLPMKALGILLALVRDESINLSHVIMQNVTTRQVQIFLDMEGEAASAADDDEDNNMKTKAGAALSVLSSNSGTNCNIIIQAHSDSIGRLTEMLDPKNNIHYRISAVDILGNLCKHGALGDKDLPKETLLRKVLSEIIRVNKREQQTISISFNRRGDKGKLNPEENSDRGDHEDAGAYLRRRAVKELHEALLSLILQLYDIVGADRYALVAQQVAPGEGAFVACLRTIIEKNCEEASVTSLRIIKLCYMIAISMLQRNQYTVQFKGTEFLESVSKATEIMSETESCMLVTGTIGLRKMTALRPLASELEHTLKQLTAT